MDELITKTYHYYFLIKKLLSNAEHSDHFGCCLAPESVRDVMRKCIVQTQSWQGYCDQSFHNCGNFENLIHNI